MNKSVLLTVELNNANLHQRAMFRSAMEAQSWSNHPRLTSIWTGTFQNTVNEGEAVRTAKSDVAQAAAKAQVPSFEVLIHIGETEPIEYNVRPQAVF
jgi:hypothetical protein